MSFPIQIGQVPVYYNRYRTGRPYEDAANYRDLSRDPLFSFGFGLTLCVLRLRTSPHHDRAKPAVASAVVTNMGEREGEEVVQLYVSSLALLRGRAPPTGTARFRAAETQPGEAARFISR